MRMTFSSACLVASLALLLGAAAGCGFNPKVPNGGTACGPLPDRACPSGYLCRFPPGFTEGICCSDETCGGKMPGGDLDAAVTPDAGAGGDGTANNGDGGPAPTDATCDPAVPSTCGPGQNCHTFCNGANPVTTACQKVGTAKRGERCIRSTDCAAGQTCLFFACNAGSQAGVCQQFCKTAAECGPDGVCTAIGCGGTNPKQPFNTCSNPCDPRPGAPVTCASGLTCMLYGYDQSDCACPGPRNTVADGGTCDNVNLACQAGLICVLERAARVCRPICRLDTPSCAAGRTCTAVASFLKYGGCSPNPDGGVPGGGGTLAGECDQTLVNSCGAGSCRVSCTGPGMGKTVCDPVTGTKATGDVCATDQECAPGLDCIFPTCPAGGGVGYCARFCKSSADCGASSRCQVLGCMGKSSQFRFCTRVCDPLGATSGCAPGLVCSLLSGDNTTCQCRTGGPNGGDGASCTTTSDCRAGHVCFISGGAPVCRPICRTMANDCAGGRTCVGLPDQRTYGACVTAGDPLPACDPAIPSSCLAGSACFVGCTGEQASVSCSTAGTVPPGGPCTRSADCAASTSCILFSCADGVMRGRCTNRCKADADCGGGTAHCQLSVCGMTTTTYGYCTTACDPRAPATSGCPSGSLCFLSPGEITDCNCQEATQIGIEGATCASSDDCQPGNTCVVEPTRRTCRPICRLDVAGGCATGRTCQATADQRIFGACMPTGGGV